MTMKNKSKYLLFLNASKDKELDVFLINANGASKERDKRNLSNANKTHKHSGVRRLHIIDKIKQEGDYKVTEYLLKSIEQILKRNKVKTADLAGIMAVTGPGPFTSLRITVAVANTLAYSLKIPVVGIQDKQGLTDNEKLVKLGLSKLSTAKVGNYISPFYDREPNITKSKK